MFILQHQFAMLDLETAGLGNSWLT